MSDERVLNILLIIILIVIQPKKKKNEAKVIGKDYIDDRMHHTHAARACV